MAAALLCTSCDRQSPRVRTYTQVAITAQTSGHEGHQHPAPAARSRTLVWETPENWQEQPGSGMRLASFTTGTGDDQATATLIVMAGDAGGAEANVRRWLDQLDLSMDAEDEFQAFWEAQTTFVTPDDQRGTLVDFTSLAGDDPATGSMIAAVIPLDGGTAFVKLTGPRQRLLAERERVLALCKSIRTAP